jgi:hypothetical protein
VGKDVCFAIRERSEWAPAPLEWRSIITARVTSGKGTVTVQTGDRRYEVRLDAGLLHTALPPSGWSAPAEVWGAAEAVAGAVQTLRRRGRLAGWRLRWWSEPLVAEPGVLWPELSLRRGVTSVGLLPLPAAQLEAKAAALGSLAQRLPFVLLSHPEGAARPPLCSHRLALLSAMM